MSSKFPWGCHILVGDKGQWPASAQMIHKHSTCECLEQGGERSLVRDYLFVIAYNYYYKRDRALYDANTCNEMVQDKARALGLSLNGQRIWDSYPNCKPGPEGSGGGSSSKRSEPKRSEIRRSEPKCSKIKRSEPNKPEPKKPEPKKPEPKKSEPKKKDDKAAAADKERFFYSSSFSSVLN